jgi:hypothetical protein
MVDELFLLAARDAPFGTGHALFRCAMARAEERGARLRAFHALDNSPAGVARMYRNAGLRPVDTVYMGIVE